MISRQTRKNVFDHLEMEEHSWSGRMSDLDFLSRLYDLKSMPSTDGRFRDAAGDIWQHTVNNSDYVGYWVVGDSRFDLLNCPDEAFLRFLCEMIHPLVQPDTDRAAKMLSVMNDWLKEDGWEIVERTRVGGKPIYSARPSNTGSTIAALRSAKVAERLGSEYVSQQITRLEVAVESDPELAIGTAKEFVETVCKSILDGAEIPHSDLDFSPLVKRTLKELLLTPDDIEKNAKGAETIKVLLNNLSAISKGLAELRNSYGTGHGKKSKTKGLQPRHARLAVGAATTLALFLLDTSELRQTKSQQDSG